MADYDDANFAGPQRSPYLQVCSRAMGSQVGATDGQVDELCGKRN